MGKSIQVTAFKHSATFFKQLLDKQYPTRYCLAMGPHPVQKTNLQMKNCNTMRSMFRIFRLKILWGDVLHQGVVRGFTESLKWVLKDI